LRKLNINTNTTNFRIMKKIITVFVLMLAFGATANAQEKAAARTPQQENTATAKPGLAYSEAAIKDIATLSNYIKLTADQKVKLKTIFTERHRTQNESLSAERKAVAAKSIEASFKAILTPDQLSKVQGNTELMKTIVSL